MAGLLRDLTFPKQMRWDAYLEDGKGDLVFARPIRWLVLLYGGRVVPFVIRRTELAQGPTVQDIRSGPNTYGHRFLTTSGRAGRAIKVKTFDDYQARLLENFVILDRARARVRRSAASSRRTPASWAARVSGLVAAQSSLLQEVPDLVEYPVGRRRPLPGRVPPASRRSADDDDDSPSALLPGGGRRGQAEAGVPRRDQHAGGEAGDHRAQLRARADGAAA